MFQLYTREWLIFKRDFSRSFIIISILSLVAALGTYWILLSQPDKARMIMEMLFSVFEEKGLTVGMNSWQLFMAIFVNNFRAALVTVAFGLIPIVILPLLSPVITSMTVGIALAFLQLEGGEPLKLLLLGIVPHGIIELPAIYLSGSIGLFISINLARKIFSSTPISFKEVLWQATRSFVLVVAPLILLAAILESTLTPFLLNTFFSESVM